MESAESSATVVASEIIAEAQPHKMTKVASVRAKYLLKELRSVSHSRTSNSLRQQMEKYLIMTRELVSEKMRLLKSTQ